MYAKLPTMGEQCGVMLAYYQARYNTADGSVNRSCRIIGVQRTGETNGRKGSEPRSSNWA